MGTVTRQKEELGSVGGSERVDRKLMDFQLALPGFDELQHGGNVQMFAGGGIFPEVGLGEFEQGGRGPQAVFLEVDECASKLDETLIECVLGAMTMREPELLQNFVGLKVKATVEAFKKAKIMGVQILSLATFDQGGDLVVFFGHEEA